MLGNIVNFFAIIIGSLIGLLAGKKISGEVQDKVMIALGLCVCFIGFQMALEVKSVMIVIISIVVGIFIGATLKIDYKLNEMGKSLEKRFTSKSNSGKPSFSQGFIAASLMYCIGSMAIIGALQAGLLKQYDTLYAKSLLDGISAIIFSSTMGIGVMFSAIPVFLYQGIITIFAGSLKEIFTDPIMADISGVGGIIIFAIGLNISGIRKIEVGDYLPAIFLPIILNIIDAMI